MALFRNVLRPNYVDLLLKASVNCGRRNFGGISYTQLVKLRGILAARALPPTAVNDRGNVRLILNQQHLCRPLSVSQAQQSEGDNDSEGKEEKKPVKKRLDVEYDALISLIDQGIVRIFDVREPKELVETGCIPTAINIPLSRLKVALSDDVEEYRQLYGERRPGKDEEHIVFYGLSGVKSSAAVEIAHKLGYKKAKHYPGGWNEWSEKRKKQQ